MELFDDIAAGAAAESTLWADALRPDAARETVPVFSPLVPDAQLALGLETIYEGYLLHYGRSRLFEPPDEDVLVCGAPSAAKDLTLELAGRLVKGRAIDAGPLANARALEGLTGVLVAINKRYKAHAGVRLTGV